METYPWRHVSRVCPKSWEVNRNLPKSAKCVMLAWHHLYDNKKD